MNILAENISTGTFCRYIIQAIIVTNLYVIKLAYTKTDGGDVEFKNAMAYTNSE